MILHAITLEDYRCHEHYHAEFNTGINLLLGKNGSGKSSVLEALGCGLFDAPLRSGTTREDAIRRGKKHARVTILFTGGDGVRYELIRRLGASAGFRLQAADGSGHCLTEKNAVLQKIRELAGITGNEKNIYQNVITAAQNQLTGIFLAGKTERETAFNQIFNTAVYREMYEGGTRAVLDRYERESSELAVALELTSRELTDEKTLKAALTAARAAVAATTAAVRDKERERDSLKAREKARAEQQERLSLARQKLQGTTELRAANVKQTTAVTAALDESTRAAAVLEESREAHDRYLATMEELRKIRDEVTRLEETDARARTLREAAAAAGESLAALQSALAARAQQMEEKSARLQEEETLLEEAVRTRDVLRTALEGHSAQLREEETLEAAFSAKLVAWREFQTRLAALDGQSSETRRNMEDEAVLAAARETIQQQLRLLGERAAALESLRTEEQGLFTRLDELSRNREALASGECPFFRETCRNLQEGADAESALAARTAALQEALAATRTRLEDEAAVPGLLQERQAEDAALAARMQQHEAAQAALARQATERALLAEAGALALEALALLVRDGTLAEQVRSGEADAVQGDLVSRVAATRKEQEHLLTRTDEAAAAIATREAASAALRETLATLQREWEALQHECATMEKTIEAHRQEAETLEKDAAPLPELKELRDAAERELQTLATPYTAHLTALTAAAKLPDHRRTLEQLAREAERLQQEEGALHRTVRETEAALDQDPGAELAAALAAADEDLDTLREGLWTAEADTRKAAEALEKNAGLHEQCAALQEQHRHLQAKAALTAVFRSRVKEMGREVAAGFMREAEERATENFRRITGRDERILWRNDQEPYQLILAPGNRPEAGNPFSILSGGEQVAIALSVRAALASLLSRSSFVVYDEPTINLDPERRAALAENLGRILAVMQQALIVTHDDTFREMAQSVLQF